MSRWTRRVIRDNHADDAAGDVLDEEAAGEGGASKFVEKDHNANLVVAPHVPILPTQTVEFSPLYYPYFL